MIDLLQRKLDAEAISQEKPFLTLLAHRSRGVNETVLDQDWLTDVNSLNLVEVLQSGELRSLFLRFEGKEPLQVEVGVFKVVRVATIALDIGIQVAILARLLQTELLISGESVPIFAEKTTIRDVASVHHTAIYHRLDCDALPTGDLKPILALHAARFIVSLTVIDKF